jgi:hypothetical protein
MYRVQLTTDDRWEIVDSKDRLVFVGTKQEAENWLDYQDNALPRAAVRGARVHALFQALRRVICRFSGCCRSAPRQWHS